MHSQLGCSTLTFRSLDLDTALDWIAAEGFKAIDLALIAKFAPHANPVSATEEERAKIKDQIGARALHVSACNAWSLTAINGPDGPTVELEYLRASLRMASALGAYAVSMQPGRKLEGADWLDHARIVSTNAHELGKMANDLGVRLTVETPHKGSLTETFDQSLQFLDMVNPDLVGVTLDTSHIHNGGSTLAAALATPAYADRIAHVHLRDYKDGSILVTPGDGEIDFGGFFQAMAARGYRGDLNLELEYPRDKPMEYNRSELQRAAQYLRPLLP